MISSAIEEKNVQEEIQPSNKLVKRSRLREILDAGTPVLCHGMDHDHGQSVMLRGAHKQSSLLSRKVKYGKHPRYRQSQQEVSKRVNWLTNGDMDRNMGTQRQLEKLGETDGVYRERYGTHGKMRKPGKTVRNTGRPENGLRRQPIRQKKKNG